MSFIEMQNKDTAIGSHHLKEGFKKISKFCALAEKHGFMYGWVDSCCIDKRNSAELSEAINSMYRYYYDAAECLVYLENIPPKAEGIVDQVGQFNAIRSSRWFTRGWTLQELIASKTRHFFAGDWSPIEISASFYGVVAEVTNIDARVLQNRDMLSSFCVAERMCWASKRETTRSEDIAYSLMGLFNVNMPIIYGEGAKKAFRRLQNEIMQTSFDQSLFAWRANYESSGLLAASPADFSNTPQLGLWHPSGLSPFVMTNVGLSARLMMMDRSEDKVRRGTLKVAQAERGFFAALQCDVKVNNSWKVLMVYLEPIQIAGFFINGKPCKAYRRARCAEWLTIPGKDLNGWPYEDVLVLQDEHYELLKFSIEDNQKRWTIARILGLGNFPDS